MVSYFYTIKTNSISVSSPTILKYWVNKSELWRSIQAVKFNCFGNLSTTTLHGWCFFRISKKLEIIKTIHCWFSIDLTGLTHLTLNSPLMTNSGITHLQSLSSLKVLSLGKATLSKDTISTLFSSMNILQTV